MLDLLLLTHQPVLTGTGVRLEPMGVQHLDGLWPMFVDEDVRAGSGTMHQFAREQVRAGLAKAASREDRADWAIVRTADDAVIGEVVLMELDEDVEAMTFRIALSGPEVFSLGYGTQATRLVRDFALGPLGLHRLALEVNADNAAAITVYLRCGFRLEGVRRDAGRRDGRWFDVHDMALLAGDARP
ncbi:MAG: GNAT family N-acetyltransferase [Actinomycetota bacterium]|nr:GNAT family N-acetyltransferase [Actinomycetota bacterium]